jgi:hypothetical protein
MRRVLSSPPPSRNRSQVIKHTVLKESAARIVGRAYPSVDGFLRSHVICRKPLYVHTLHAPYVIHSHVTRAIRYTFTRYTCHIFRAPCIFRPSLTSHASCTSMYTVDTTAPSPAGGPQTSYPGPARRAALAPPRCPARALPLVTDERQRSCSRTNV